jgi:hypothetical protein
MFRPSLKLRDKSFSHFPHNGRPDGVSGHAENPDGSMILADSDSGKNVRKCGKLGFQFPTYFPSPRTGNFPSKG